MGMRVNFYDLHFLFSYFSTQPNKRVFHLFTFTLNQIHGGKTKSFLSTNFITTSLFSIFPLFHHFSQMGHKYY